MINVHRELPFIIEKIFQERKDQKIDTFCPYVAPAFSIVEYRDQKWSEIEVRPYGPLLIYPDSKVLHYAQEIFEGLKAYWIKTNHPLLFRPIENFHRFNRSAERMGMPIIPQDIFLKAVEVVVDLNKQFIPRVSSKSLYIRPFMFASENQLGITPCTQFTFVVVASPAASYMGNEVHVLVERKRARAVIGGTGEAKTGGNYAAAQLTTLDAKKLNFHQVLWLDAIEHKYVEELSGMNIFFLRKNQLVTPRLSGTILEGITRKSIIHLCKNELSIPVSEEKLPIDQVIAEIKNHTITEAFASGTAAIINPLAALGEISGEKYFLKEKVGTVTQKIRETLLGIQEGTLPDKHHFTHAVKDLSPEFHYID